MRPFLLYIISAIALFSSCNWVNDDLSDCPSGTWLKISYTYNILDVDAASTQVSDITILVKSNFSLFCFIVISPNYIVYFIFLSRYDYIHHGTDRNRAYHTLAIVRLSEYNYSDRI